MNNVQYKMHPISDRSPNLFASRLPTKQNEQKSKKKVADLPVRTVPPFSMREKNVPFTPFPFFLISYLQVRVPVPPVPYRVNK